MSQEIVQTASRTDLSSDVRPLLVTGASGLVGNNVVRLLLDQGRAVRVMIRESADRRPLAGLDVERMIGDVRNPRTVREACEGVGGVIHAAALVHIGWTRVEEQRATNVEGTRHVAEAARAAGLRMVHVSSVDVLGVSPTVAPASEETKCTPNPPCGYVVTKREADDCVERFIGQGLDAVIVHPGFMLGPWDWKPSSGRMLLEIAKRCPPLAPWGGCSACDVRDVARGIVGAFDEGRTGRHYILAGHNLRYVELWQIMASIAGRRAPRRRAGPLIRLIAGRVGDLASWVRKREGDVNSAAVAMSNLCHYYTSGRAQTELGYTVRPLEETVRDAWTWFQEHGFLTSTR